MGIYTSGTSYIDDLIQGYTWTGVIGAGANISYGFGKAPPENDTSGRKLVVETNVFNIDPSFEKAVGAAAGIWSQYANVHFNKVTASVSNPVTQPVLFGLTYNNLPSGDEGVTYPGGTPNGQTLKSADVIIAPDMGGAELRQGQYGFFVLLHEMGHALGLKHSFESPALPAAEDNMDHSIMSYTDGTYAKRGFGLAPATPAPDDIAALQFLYGANMSTNAGDNRYTIKAGDPLHTIWDAGGHDIIDTTSYNAGAVIDLQEGGDHPIHLGSTAVWLAYNSHIEDAVAGAGNDTIIGNTLNNVLTGNAGNDSIVGGGGSDQIFGNDGNDTIGAGGNSLIDGGNGIDAISYQSASGVVVNLQDILGTGVDSLGDTIRSIEAGIFGSPGNDSINGNAAANYLTGGDGGDLIQGFAGNDSLNGNAGNDSIAGGDGLDVIFGGQGDDSLNGNAGADTLSGDKGNDTIFGGKGGDSIAAGDGDDYLNGNLGNDTLSGDAGNDTLIGEDGDDSLSGGADNDVLVGGIGNDTLFGGVGNDTIYGGPGANVIDAGAGNDMIVTGGVGEILTGGNGNDTFAIFGVGGAIINDFVTSQDHIEFHDIFLNTKAAIAATSFDGTNATIFLPGGEVITLLHVPVRLVAEDISIINTA